MRVNPELKASCVQSLLKNMSLLFGFQDDEGGGDLKACVNEAIDALRSDDTLDALQERYLDPAGDAELLPVEFETFPESDETIFL